MTIAETAVTLRPVEPVFANALVDQSVQKDLEYQRNRKVYDGPAPVNASSMGGCARALSYKSLRCEGKQWTEASKSNVSVGTAVHSAIELLAEATTEERDSIDARVRELYGRPSIFGAFPGVEFESKDTGFNFCNDDGVIYLSGRYDSAAKCAQIMGDFKTAATTKLINLQQWALGGGPSWGGPDVGYLLQVGAAAISVRYDRCRIGYIAKQGFNKTEKTDFLKRTNVSLDDLPCEGRVFEVEWSIAEGTAERAVLDRGLNRAQKIVELAAVNKLAPRVMFDMPPTARIYEIVEGDNGKLQGNWEERRGGQLMSAGKAWQCGYCDFSDQCINDMETENE